MDRVVVLTTTTPSMVPVWITLLQKNVIFGATRNIRDVDAKTYVVPLELSRFTLFLLPPSPEPIPLVLLHGVDKMARNVVCAPKMP